MRLIPSIVVAVVVMIAMLTASWLFNADEERGNDTQSQSDDWMVAILFGLLAGVVNYFVPMFYVGSSLAFLAPVCLAVMVCMTIYLMYIWSKEGTCFRDMLPLIVVAVVIFFITKAAAIMTAAMVEDYFLYTLILVIPELMLVLAIGFFVTSLFLYYYRRLNRGNLNKILALCAGIVTAIIMLALLFTRVNWGGFTDMMASVFRTPDPYGQEEFINEGDAEYEYSDADYTADESATWYGFYNLNLQTDADPRNDFNFGPNPFTENATAKDYDAEMRTRMSKDPALAVANMAWLDAIVGTRYLGEFYESCKGDWAKTINLAKVRFMEDQGLYYQTLNAFFAFMDTADAITLDYQTSDLDDQMYMNPKTVDGVPDVIVMTTTDHSGYFLTYTFYIKEVAFKVAYRIDCGYQPTNVEEVMHIVPDDTPRNPQPTPTPDPDPDPVPPPQTDPTPETDPTHGNGDTPTPKKDPSKSPKINTEPNDDPGPGPNTNTGKGSNTSKADQPTNSNHGTQEQYNQAIKDLKDTNTTQKTGSDSNTPSTPAPTPSTKVDNNGDKGNGGAPINTPTPVSAPATVANTGEAISDSPGEAWGGPVD